jgi:hypothetical protein
MTTTARHAMALLVLGFLASAGPAAAAGLYGSTTVAPSGWRTDLAYNRDRGEFLAVWTSNAPSGNSQIWGRRYRESGDPVAAAFPLTDGTQDDVVPQVAYDHHVKRYLVTWRVMGSSAHAVALKGQLFDTNAAPASAELSFSDNEPLQVAIAARNQREHGPSGVAFLVVWRTWGGLHATRVRGDGILLPETDLANSSDGPVRAAYDPRVDRFLVAYRDSPSVRARLIGADGTLQPAFTVGTQGSCASHDVAFDPASRRYLVAWSAPAASGGCEVKGAFYNSSTVLPALQTTITLAATAGTIEQHVGAVEAEPGTFVVANGEPSPGLPQWHEALRLRRFRADGLFINEVNVGIARTGDYAGLAVGAHGATPVSFGTPSMTVQLAMFDRWFARSVHGRGDADGDGRSDLTVFQPWSSTSITKTQVSTTSTVFAVPGAVPVLLDWDGDGLTDRCVWEPGTGTWSILQSSDGASASLMLGRAGDVPVPGDYLGLGRDQAAVFRPSTGEWVIQASQQGPFGIAFGEVGDMPVPADWNGDGDIELGLWRPSTGQWLAAETDGTPVGVPSTAWGQAGDSPFGGDVVGDGRADQVVYRRQLGVAWVRDGATGATSTITIGDGLLMPLDWNGDGKTDLAAADHEQQVWRIRVGALAITVTFGTIGDIPAAH